MLRLAIALAVLTTVLAACGGDSKSNAPASPTATGGHVEQESFNDIVLTGAARAAAAGYHGTYGVRATVDGKVTDGVVTWSRKNDRMRADFTGKSDSQDLEIHVITGAKYPAEDLLYVCTPAAKTCREAHRAPQGDYPAEALPSVFALRLLDARVFSQGLTFSDETARTISGQAVLCFSGQAASGATDHGTVCLTGAGLPLLVTAAGAARTQSLTATKFEAGVDENVFDLPYPLEGQ